MGVEISRDEEILESLDFEQVCQATSGCGVSASWYLDKLPCPGCGFTTHLFCDTHAKRLFDCQQEIIRGISRWMCTFCGTRYSGKIILGSWRV